MRRTVLAYLLCLFCLETRADYHLLSELESHGRLLCASAMLYFDPRQREPDPRSLTAVFHHLNTLHSAVQRLGSPTSLQRPLQGMQHIFTELENLPRTQRAQYPALIRRLVEQQAALHESASQMRAQQAGKGDDSVFGELTRDLAALLFDYQLRHYPLGDKAIWLSSGTHLAEQERKIEAHFAQLLQRHPEQTAALVRIRGSYRFVRPQLQHGDGEGHGGAEFYLSRAVLDLDELALRIRAP